MTVLISYNNNNSVYFAADKQSSLGYVKASESTIKILTDNNYLMVASCGYTDAKGLLSHLIDKNFTAMEDVGDLFYYKIPKELSNYISWAVDNVYLVCVGLEVWRVRLEMSKGQVQYTAGKVEDRVIVDGSGHIEARNYLCQSKEFKKEKDIINLLQKTIKFVDQQNMSCNGESVIFKQTVVGNEFKTERVL